MVYLAVFRTMDEAVLRAVCRAVDPAMGRASETVNRAGDGALYQAVYRAMWEARPETTRFEWQYFGLNRYLVGVG